MIWDGGRRKRFLYLSEQYYFPWRWSITSVADEVLLLSHLKYYSCFNITFLGCDHNEIPLLPISCPLHSVRFRLLWPLFRSWTQNKMNFLKMFSNFFCREICWNQNNSLILPVTHRKPICKGEWVIYWKGRLRNVILESSNLANLKPSPKVRQRERPQRVYYIPTYSEQPLLSSGYSLYLNYNTSRRGLSVLLILEMEAMREPEDWG